MPPTDAPRCGNCRWWSCPGYDRGHRFGQCIIKIDSVKIPDCMERSPMHDTDNGSACPCHAPKEPDK